MEQITITKGATTITMPKTRSLSVNGTAVEKTAAMASGKNIKEMTGHRTTITASWKAVPQATMNSLTTLLRQGGFFTVAYPDTDGTDKTASFTISYPSPGVWKYQDGNPVWANVTLNMSAQEVT
jgi:hypothetical protein